MLALLDTLSQVAGILGVPLAVLGLMIALRTGSGPEEKVPATEQIGPGLPLHRELTRPARVVLAVVSLLAGLGVFYGISTFFVTFERGTYSPWWTWILSSLLFAGLVNAVVVPGSRRLDVELARALREVGPTGSVSLALVAKVAVFAGWVAVSYAIVYHWYTPRPFGLWRIMLFPFRAPLLPIADPGYGPYQGYLLWMGAATVFVAHQGLSRLANPVRLV